MDTTELRTLLSQLSSDLTSLETALCPLLGTTTASKPASAMSANLSLLSKAKLYALASYSVNSVVFNHTRLSGADAKQHPVFAELARVKSYFEKIKTAEFPDAGKPTVRIDKDAVGRFVRAGLAGNHQSAPAAQQSAESTRRADRSDKRDNEVGTGPFDEAGRKKRKRDKKNKSKEGEAPATSTTRFTCPIKL